MKYDHKLLFATVVALGLPLLGGASTLEQAQITAIVKDVKTIDPGKAAREAILKETLQGEQSVRTGIESRTELLFNDHTITRLGANTHFSFTEGTRNMSLDSGVMLLQVPKGIGGAKIETAAVSAAVTGTTIMVEAGKDYTKLIVLEGECCLWPRNKKLDKSPIQSKLYRAHHEVCALAGQEIILRNGAKDVPDPVYVNLRVLENSSLLLNGNWGASLNNGPINSAAAGQGPNEYNPTNLAIIGAGTDVVIIQQEYTPPGTTPPPGTTIGGGSTPPFVPPGKYGPLITITSANPYSIGAGSAINTDPRITTGGVTDYGRIYRGVTLDGDPSPYFLGTPDQGLNGDFDNLDGQGFPNYGIAAFKFVNLELSGVPTLDMSTNGATDMVLVSEGNIDINATGTLDFTPLNDLIFATAGGNITLESTATIQGLTGFLEFYSQGTADNVVLNGDVNLPDADFFSHSQGTFSGTGAINAVNIDIKAGGPLSLVESLAYTPSDDSFSTVDTVNGVQVSSNSYDAGTNLSSLTLTGNGITVPDGFTADLPYSEGYYGFVDLTLDSTTSGATLGDITLGNAFALNSLTANADDNITADDTSYLYVNNDITLNAGNDINFDGSVYNATDFIASAGNNLIISCAATIDTDNSIQLCANNDIEIDGALSSGNISASANGTVTTGSASNISANSFEVVAGSGITLDGIIDVYTLTGSTGSGNIGTTLTSDLIDASGSVALVTTGGSLAFAGTIDASSFSGSSTSDATLDGTISAGTVTVDAGGNISTTLSSDVLIGSTSVTLTASSGNLMLSGSISTPDFSGTAGGNVTLDGTLIAGTVSVNAGGNISSTLASDLIEGSTSVTLTSNGYTSLTGQISTQSLTINAGGSLTISSTAGISSDYTYLYGQYVQLDGTVVGYSAPLASYLYVNTTSGNGSILNGNNQDFFSSGSTGSVDAVSIQIFSGGDLNLAGTSLNGVAINPSGGLQVLELSGSTVEIPNGFTLNTSDDTDNPVSFTLSVTANSGGVAIGGGIAIGDLVNPGEFDASASGTNPITITGSTTTISAGTINLTGGEIINQSGAAGPVLISTGSASTLLSLNVSNVGGILTQTGGTADPSAFTFVQTGTDGSPIASGTVPFMLSGSGSSPTLSISANSLTVMGTVDVTSFSGSSSGFTLNLTSANDINGGTNATSATILGAESVGLQVGVDATIVGDNSSTIDYNDGQLLIDTTNLTSFSLTANSIIVEDSDSGFPSLGSGSLSLTSSGSGGITVNTPLSTGNGITLTANNSGAVNVNEQIYTGGDLNITAGNGISIAGDIGQYFGEAYTAIGGSVDLTAYNGDIDVTSPDIIVMTGSLNINAENGNILLGNIDTYISTGSGAGVSLTASGTISIADSVYLHGPLNISAGADVVTDNEITSVFYGATDVTLALTGTQAILTESADSSTLYFGGLQDSNYYWIGIDLTGSTVTSVSASGTSMALSGSFDVPVPLALIATDGSIAISGSGVVSATSLTLASTNGDINVGEPVNLTGNFEADASNGNLVVNSPVTLTGSGGFSGTASSISINAPINAASFYGDSTSGNITIGGSTMLTGNFSATASGTLAVNSPVAASAFSGTGSAISINAPVNAASFYGDSKNGNITIGGSMTLTGNFNAIASGTLIVNSPVTASAFSGTGSAISINVPINVDSFDGDSTSGDITIGGSMTLIGNFYANASGDLVVNQPIVSSTFQGYGTNITINSTVNGGPDFEAYANNTISGTGSISAQNVTLEQSGAATVSQTGSQAAANEVVFDNINVILSGSESTALTLEGGPLTISTPLTLNSTDLTLFGAVSTGTNTISALDVNLYFVSTATDASGNATALNVTGSNSVNIDGVSLEGAAGTSGSGGSFTAMTLASDIDVASFGLQADGGSAGGNGGTINLTSEQNIYTYGDITANGGAGGGNGGTIGLTANMGDITALADIDANGGLGSGKGGTINLTADEGDINTYGNLYANGGDASSASAAGGNGGTVNLTAGGNINVQPGSNIFATSGINGSSTFPGGAGGAVNLVASGAITVGGTSGPTSTIQVSSSDLVNNRVSASPGNITVTSHATTGTAINIQSTAQLLSILNQAAPGPGGNITFTADGGGDIAVSGSVRADAGTIGIINSGSSSGNVTISGATLSANVIKASVLSPNGTLTVGSPTANTSLSADSAIKLYALGDNGSVDFVGNTYLSGASIKSIAGQTVTINNGVSVNVTGGAATVYTTTPNYTGSGGNKSTTGQFTGNTNTTTQPFANRPTF